MKSFAVVDFAVVEIDVVEIAVVEIAIIEFAIEAKARPRGGGAATRRVMLEQGERVRLCEGLTFVAVMSGPDISSSRLREER